MEKRAETQTRPCLSSSWIDRVTITRLVWWGAIIRLVLIAYAHFHDIWFPVKYTDIDYMIIVDGAREMWHGGSPFDRTTFRYTPLLALLVLPSVVIAHPMGKLLFALCDLSAAYYCYEVLITFAKERSAKWMVSLFILFNPVVLSVSTRGNSDMLITFLSLLVLAKFSQSKYYQAAAFLGFAVHFKIYPVIYALPLVLGVWERSSEISDVFRRVVHTAPLIVTCGLLTLVTFVVPTILCYYWFGQRYLDEAFIYHVYREDHRHNFSPYWLLMYLNMARQHLGVGVSYAPGLLAFVPQALALFVVSYKLRRNIAHAACVQTVIFVAFNKVCTVQYFVWFIPFLGFIFCEPKEGNLTGVNQPTLLRIVSVITLWAVTIPLWVLIAFPLEFQGRNDFGRLWVVSCVFFLAMVGLATWLAGVARRIQDAIVEKKAKHD